MARTKNGREIWRTSRWPRRLRLGCLGLAGMVSLFLLVKAATWPDVAALAERNPESTAFIDRARRAGREVRWSWVPYERISPHLKRAVLVSEDINFFSHDGFDTAELRRAVDEALAGKRLRGASTLTQQLAKNLWLSPSRNPLRKLEEAVLTRQLERRLDKRRILELYLNVAELGPEIFGAEAAARHYYGTSAANLSEQQAAELAASLPRPSTWNPGRTSKGYRSRVRSVLRRMERAQWLWRVI